MLWMAGAAGAALDVLATLQKTLATPGAPSGGIAAPFALGDTVTPTPARINAANAIAPSTLSALFPMQGQSSTADRVSSAIFSALDTNGDGALSQAEFTAGLADPSGAGRGLAQLLQKQAQSLVPPGQSLAMTA